MRLNTYTDWPHLQGAIPHTWRRQDGLETCEVAGAARGDPPHPWGPPCYEISATPQEFLGISPSFTAVTNRCERIECFAANTSPVFSSALSVFLVRNEVHQLVYYCTPLLRNSDAESQFQLYLPKYPHFIHKKIFEEERKE